MTARPASSPRQRARLVDELAEAGLDLGGGEPWHELVVDELDYARRPPVHERRVPSFGAIVAPTEPPERWGPPTALQIEHRPIAASSLAMARRYADGLSSWLIRAVDGVDESAVFNRPSGSERDLVVIAEATGATLVQRHPSGVVRIVGTAGVHRWDGIFWHHEPPVASWIDTVQTCAGHGDSDVVELLVEFAVHDLGARGIGATLVYHPDERLEGSFEPRMAPPPPLNVLHPADLAPIRHVLAQIDGAALVDAGGTLRQIGVRLVPTLAAENEVEGLRGMRHTAARRYSYDDPTATVIVVSEDGPVTVLRNGQILGASPPG